MRVGRYFRYLPGGLGFAPGVGMFPNRAVLFAFAPVVLGIAGLACNGRVSPDDTGSLTSKARTGEAEKEKTDEQDPAPSTTVKPPVSGAGQTAGASSCTYEYQSSSSSGDPPLVFQCESTDNYTCNDGPTELSCTCSGSQGKWQAQGSCSCHGITFAFDCATGCSPGPKEYAKCNFPAPPADDSGTSGWSSSSSSSSG
jgi:hypothetical protein